MESGVLIGHARALLGRIDAYGRSQESADAAKAQVSEFLRQYGGPKSAFTAQAERVGSWPPEFAFASLKAIVESFIEYVEAGLAQGLSPERQAKLDVVSDILEQAHFMLERAGYHPAAAAVLIGASLEEFLRAWVESVEISLGNAKPGIDAYCKVLRSQELITKQDAKDITSWAGIRNHAAHGEWEQVSNVDRIRLMLDGVNLFMRQHGSESPA